MAALTSPLLVRVHGLTERAVACVGDYCVACPLGVCTTTTTTGSNSQSGHNDDDSVQGAVITHSGNGFWLVHARQSDASLSLVTSSLPASALVSTSANSAVVVLECSPPEACVAGNLCAAGYEGDMVSGPVRPSSFCDVACC